MKIPHFIAHNKGDVCAVAVVEDIQQNTECQVWNMETDEVSTVQVLHNIPIGHKVALQNLKSGDAVIKYGVDIGKCVAEVSFGAHLHTHNLKTKRW